VTQAASLTLDRLSKHFADHVAVDEVSLEVRPGEMIVLLGPSGCGKTTTLRMVAGFIPASSGDIRLDGVSIAGLPPYRRDMGIVFQSYALFPHLTISRNIAFGLEMRRMDRAAIDARVAAMLRLVKLDAYADRLPRQLSGGQQQRVAVARALVANPKLILADEPTGNLDTANGEAVMDMLTRIMNSGTTIVMVTHSEEHAKRAHRVVNMLDGRLVDSTEV
jgi:putative spermidine/putrescine transport system ATP-binding protein